MAEATAAAKPARRRGGALMAVLAAILFGGGSFHLVSSDLVPRPSAILGRGGGYALPADWHPPSAVPVPPILVSLGEQASAGHLRVGLVLDVEPGSEVAVEAAMTRIVDTLTRFLRAVDERDFASPANTTRLRAQMLRRVQFAAPPGAVRDVLIHEFLME